MIFHGGVNLLRTFFRFVTIHAFDRLTDRRTDVRIALSWLDRGACNAYSAVKIDIEAADTIRYIDIEMIRRHFDKLLILMSQQTKAVARDACISQRRVDSTQWTDN